MSSHVVNHPTENFALVAVPLPLHVLPSSLQKQKQQQQPQQPQQPATLAEALQLAPADAPPQQQQPPPQQPPQQPPPQQQQQVVDVAGVEERLVTGSGEEVSDPELSTWVDQLQQEVRGRGMAGKGRGHKGTCSRRKPEGEGQRGFTCLAVAAVAVRQPRASAAGERAGGCSSLMGCSS
jgi:hypothetical protein